MLPDIEKKTLLNQEGFLFYLNRIKTEESRFYNSFTTLATTCGLPSV